MGFGGRGRSGGHDSASSLRTEAHLTLPVQGGAVQGGSVTGSTVQGGTAQSGTVQGGAAEGGSMQAGTTQGRVHATSVKGSSSNIRSGGGGGGASTSITQFSMSGSSVVGGVRAQSPHGVRAQSPHGGGGVRAQSPHGGGGVGRYETGSRGRAPASRSKYAIRQRKVTKKDLEAVARRVRLTIAGGGGK
jgi:hypothetical protein